MTEYRRLRVAGGCYFSTVALNDRREKLLVEHVEVLRAAFAEVKSKHRFRMDAIVVLPEHLHCIWTMPDGDCDFSTRWRLIKSAFSRHFPRQEQRTASRMNKQERGIWQRRFWEHAIRDETDFRRHADYIHFNPVKHGLVASPADWLHSSFMKYVGRGLYPANWGREFDGRGMDGLE